MWVLVLVAMAGMVVALVAPRRARASRDRPWAIAERVLAWSAIGWSVSVTLYLLLAATYEGVTAEAFDALDEQVTTGRRTFLEVNGGVGLAFVLVPVVLTALPWLVSDSTGRRRLQTIGAGLLLTFVLVGSLSVGLLYLPGALAMVMAAALSSARWRRPPQAGT